ncbi:Bdr family repetitive protein (plasmid) [Borrelia miyamotoi]|uniref:Bdr family repetitive protein n=1 Tax=Borrelia miyamotoi TaxID=47466 RepID=A0AAX3JP14_9SPIR|nr:Bdr family repetitive protein [Borrelia miyamotoi]WAZ72527.1 Bdr family repetitive protein [Borrelia miyamotoi]
MGLPQSVITRQMVLSELIKAGINQEIAEDLSYRYYKNELTHKDIEYLKENFDIKLEKVEVGLKADIKASHSDLDNKIDNIENNLNNKIDTKFTELDNKIDNVENNLNNKIDTKFTELDNKIDNVENNLNNKIDTKFTELDNKIDNVENNLNNKIDTKFTELDNKIDKVETSLKSDIASVSNEVALVRKDMEINKMELNSQLVKITSKLESSFKLHYWMFGTVITLFVGIFLTLIFK